MILPSPTRYLHVLDNTEGRQDAIPWEVLTRNKESPFGVAGQDYNILFPYKVYPMYTEEEVLKILDQSELEIGGKQLPATLGGPIETSPETPPPPPAASPAAQEGKSVLSCGTQIKSVSRNVEDKSKGATKKPAAKKTSKPAAKKTTKAKSERTPRTRNKAVGS